MLLVHEAANSSNVCYATWAPSRVDDPFQLYTSLHVTTAKYPGHFVTLRSAAASDGELVTLYVPLSLVHGVDA